MVTSDAVYKTFSQYNSKTIAEVDSNANFIELSNLYPNLNNENSLKSNVFVITSRNGETHILICGTTDGGTAITPQWYQLYIGTEKVLSVTYDLNSRKIRIKNGTYNRLEIRQIGGSATNISYSIVSEGFSNSVTKRVIQYS